MAKPLSVLFVSSEVYPFIKTTEYADLCYAHSLGAREVGHDIRVMMPKYGNISERKNRIHEINRLRDMPIPIGTDEHLATVKSSSINNPRVKVQAYITTNTNYLDVNKGIMHDVVSGVEFPNNDERYMFFNRTVIETCMLLGWFPDVIHCMGWQAGLLPAYLRTMYAQDFRKTKIVMTITDFDEQGVFPLKSLAKTGLPEEALAAAKYKNKMNFLRAGIFYADRVTTLSPGYANELLANKEFKDQWLPLLHKRPLAGIPHGVDLMQWNPKTDAALKHKYDAKDTSNKVHAKEFLQKVCGLPVDPQAFVATYIGPLTESQGADILLAAVPALVASGAQVIIGADLPMADRKNFEALAKKFPKNVSFTYPMEEEFVHQLMAGSTVLLKPARSCPSGQFQRVALVYGTIPIGHITGGLAEVLLDVDGKTGNAFLFKKAETADFLKAVARAQLAHAEQETWNAIVSNAMSTNVSWSASALPYDELYRTLMKDKE